MRSVPSKIPQNHTVFLMDLMRIFPMGPRSFRRTFVLERSPLGPLGNLHTLLLLLLLLLLMLISGPHGLL